MIIGKRINLFDQLINLNNLLRRKYYRYDLENNLGNGELRSIGSLLR